MAKLNSLKSGSFKKVSKVHFKQSCCTAMTKGKTPVPVCSPKLSPVGRG